jgi:hypothetical protein
MYLELINRRVKRSEKLRFGSNLNYFPVFFVLTFFHLLDSRRDHRAADVRRSTGTFPGLFLRLQVVSERGGRRSPTLRRSRGGLVVRSTREKKKEVVNARSSRHE